MESVEWRMKGQWIKNCNCAYGCLALSGLSWAAANSHSTLAKVDHGPKGLVHPAS
jgi:hypothetical protein